MERVICISEYNSCICIVGNYGEAMVFYTDSETRALLDSIDDIEVFIESVADELSSYWDTHANMYDIDNEDECDSDCHVDAEFDVHGYCMNPECLLTNPHKNIIAFQDGTSPLAEFFSNCIENNKRRRFKSAQQN